MEQNITALAPVETPVSDWREELARAWEWLCGQAALTLLFAVKNVPGKPGKGKAAKKPAKPRKSAPAREPDDDELDGDEGPDEDEAEGDESDDEVDEELEEGLLAEEEAEGEDEDAEISDRDKDLIARFLDGNQESFGRLVEKYQNKVYNLCCRIMGDRDEAMDMAQEVFITVHKSLAGFRGDSLFSTWIFRVTVNHCKNRIKYLGRRRYYQTTSIDQPLEVGDGEVYFELEDESPDPELTVASEEVQAVVQAAINGLDSDHRVAVVLRDIQGLSYEEIADILGIKVGTVKSRIHRARGELKKKLEPRFKKKSGV